MNNHCQDYLGFNHIIILMFFPLSHLHNLLSELLWYKALGITLQLNMFDTARYRTVGQHL